MAKASGKGQKAARGREKPPIPRYQYKLVAVSSSHEAGRMETALRERLGGSGLSFFAICHQSGGCDVMCDSGEIPQADAALRHARAVAAGIKQGAKGKPGHDHRSRDSDKTR